MDRRPGIRDVAAMAGVSRQTVSRVLNDHPSVTSATRTRVSDAIAGIGYVANNGARSLRSGRARMIAIFVLPDARKTGVRLLPQLEAIIHKAGSWSIVRFLEDGDDLGRNVLESTRAVADGAIIMHSPHGGRAGGAFSPGQRAASDFGSIDAFVRGLADGDSVPRLAATTALIMHVALDDHDLVGDLVGADHSHISTLPLPRKT